MLVSIPSNRVIVSISKEDRYGSEIVDASQSPQIGSLFQYMATEVKILENGSQSPQIGSLFQFR